MLKKLNRTTGGLVILVGIALLLLVFIISRNDSPSIASEGFSEDRAEHEVSANDNLKHQYSKLSQDREKRKTLRNLRETLQARERKRIIDSSVSARRMKITEAVREQYRISPDVSELPIEVDQFIIRQPSESEADALEQLISKTLETIPFHEKKEREAAEKKLQDRYINYPDKLKLVEFNKLIYHSNGATKEWITVYNTSEIMQLKKPEGALLSPKNYSLQEVERFESLQNAFSLYGYLFDQER